MSNFIMPIGVDRNWQITIQQPDPITGLMVTSTQFIVGDTLTAQVWAGQGQETIFSPTVTWNSIPSTGIVNLSISAAQTSTLTPGKYTLRVLVNTTDGRSLPVLQATLDLQSSPGTATPPTVYAEYTDLLAYAGWLDDLDEVDADQSGFAAQRHKARAWLEGIILNRCPAGVGFAGSLGFGVSNGYNYDGINPYIKGLLDQNRLVVTEQVIEIVSRYAIALICDSLISPTDDKSGYQVFGAMQFSLANALISGYTAQIDVVGNGTPPYLPIPWRDHVFQGADSNLLVQLMFRAKMTGDKAMWGRLRGFSSMDFKEIVPDVKSIIIEDNMRGLHVGTDANEQPLDPVVTPSSKRGGNGPPTIPRFDESRTIKNFRVTPRRSAGQWVFDCYWRSCDYMRFWKQRFRIFGVRPEGRAKIMRVVMAFLHKKFQK